MASLLSMSADQSFNHDVYISSIAYEKWRRNAMSSTPNPDTLELRRLRLEERRYLSEILKWVIVAAGAVISFYVIDVGKLRLEEFRTRAEYQRSLLKEYLTATETAQPEVWKRKLHVLATYSNDNQIRSWAKEQSKYVEDYAEK